MSNFPSLHFTEEQGLAIELINKTGTTSVKGTVVQASSAMNESFESQADQDDNIGVVYQNGIADGERCLIVIAGIAQVLLENSTASVRGNWVFASTVDGRANATLTTPPGGGIPEHDEHFKEIGHCVESKDAGTDVLAKIILHFN